MWEALFWALVVHLVLAICGRVRGNRVQSDRPLAVSANNENSEKR